MVRNIILAFIMLLVFAAIVGILALVVVEDADLLTPPADEPGAHPTQPAAPDETPEADADPRDTSPADEPGPDASAPAEPADQGDTLTPGIRRVAMNGQDLADLLSIRAWKFAYQLPADDYSVEIYLERWERGDEQPQRLTLLSQSISTGEDDILLRLPTRDQPALFVRVGPATARASNADPLNVPSPARVDALDQGEIAVGEPVHLVTFTHNAADQPRGGLRGVHHDHDVTVYLVARFIPRAEQHLDR